MRAEAPRAMTCSSEIRSSDPLPLGRDAPDLPPAWPDELDLRLPWNAARFLAAIFGRRRAVHLPAQLPGAERIPRYVLQEFHRLPNGFYSRRVANGYARQFDRTMLGATVEARKAIVSRAGQAECVLDLGCGDGKLAQSFVDSGARDVWALDACPYLLQLGARARPAVKFVHGAAEDLPFPSERFDAIAACFLFHELPPKAARSALFECSRSLKPGGRLVLCEPAPDQLQRGAWLRSTRAHGWRGAYFTALARWMFEPFVELWQRTDFGPWFASAGLQWIEDHTEFPCRYFVARKA